MVEVLIVADPNDPHVSAVTYHLDALAVSWTVVSQGSVYNDHVSIEFDPYNVTVGRVHDFDCRSVWYRRAIPPHIPDLSNGLLRFARQEFSEAFKGFLLTLRDAHWVSDPSAIRDASYKPLQLFLASRRFGLAIPPTLITSDPTRAREFVRRFKKEGCVAKCLGRNVIEYEDRMTSLFTTLVDESSIGELDSVALAPCIFQPFIRKCFEVRATVIGNKIYAVQMDTGNMPAAALDWRHVDYRDIRHTQIDLPSSVGEACLGICSYFGLRFAAFDFLISEDGIWYFLEINPNGQWLWIEDMTGLPLAYALANEICGN